MDDLSLVKSFNDSLGSDTADIVSDFSELGLDSIMDEGVLKDIPFVSTAVSLYKIGSSIRDRYNIRKIATFVQSINANIADEKERSSYREKFYKKESFRKQELEYLLIIIDRYLTDDKAKLLGKVYLAYIDERIPWDLFLKYSNIIDRFLPGDLNELMEIYNYPFAGKYGHPATIITDSTLRLVSQGLLYESERNQIQRKSLLSLPHEDTCVYKLTDIGSTLVEILGDD